MIKGSKNRGSRKSEEITPPPRTRVARGYTEKPKKKGYRYKKPGYVYTTPSTTTTTTTRAPPLAESFEENSADFNTPPPEDPTGVSPERGFVTEGPTRSPFVSWRGI